MSESVVVVTGGGRGIGRAICERFAGDGARVVAAARSSGELEETQQLIKRSGGECHVIPTDVCRSGDIESLIETTVARLGRVDVLVNNAGVAPLASMEELDPSVFEAIMAVNVNAVYRGCRAVWPVMGKQGKGVIVNISSASSVDPFPGLCAYGAAKAWVNAWTKGLADEGRRHGIQVFSVAPGAVDTRMLRGAFPEYPLDEAMQPSEVADVVHSLAQPACRFASGQTVFLKR